MKNYNDDSCSGGIARLSALLFLVISFSAHATAPRITAQLFGEEQKVDIVAYQPASPEVSPETALAVEIVTQAFYAAGKTPVVDVLPSKQLAIYALLNNEAAGLIGRPGDMPAKGTYRMVTFYLGGVASQPVCLIFSNARGRALHNAFVEGVQKILKNGRYLEILEEHHVKVPADYVSRLKRLNPGWK